MTEVIISEITRSEYGNFGIKDADIIAIEAFIQVSPGLAKIINDFIITKTLSSKASSTKELKVAAGDTEATETATKTEKDRASGLLQLFDAVHEDSRLQAYLAAAVNTILHMVNVNVANKTDIGPTKITVLPFSSPVFVKETGRRVTQEIRAIV